MSYVRQNNKRATRGERGVAWHAPPYSPRSMMAVSMFFELLNVYMLCVNEGFVGILQANVPFRSTLCNYSYFSDLLHSFTSLIRLPTSSPGQT
jgi:hypothetical protein